MTDSGDRRRFVWTSVLLAVMLAAGSSLVTAAEQARVVGELEPISIGSAHPYARGSSGEWTIRHPGATYIRVHFSQFDLADGDRLTISNPAGSESYVYKARGPHGNGSFWAFTILGDTAILSLDASTGDRHGFEVDGYGRGTVDIGLPEPDMPRSVCGTQDWQDVACYEQSNPTEFENARGAALALIGCCSACTTFKVSDGGQFMTNEHCTNSNAGVQSTEVRFEFQRSACNGGVSSFSGAVMGQSLLATDFGLDYTLFTTTGDSGSIPCLELDPRLPAVGEPLYIAHQPGGGVKKLSIESTQNAGGLCRVDAAPVNGRFVNSDVGYFCDTTNGSSGSPVLSADTHKVIALHHFGGCLNSGGRIDLIRPQIAAVLDSCSGGTECGNGVREAGEQCDGGDIGTADCSDVGCGSGAPACAADCTLDFSGCAGCPVCDGDGVCESGEDCNDCTTDCFAGSTGAVCGNGVCEIGGGEDCASCPQDCNGKLNGNPGARYCCGGDADCADARCAASGNSCSAGAGDPTCCGDGNCEGTEDSFNCEVDCGAAPFCGDNVCASGSGENPCTCPADCGTAPAGEVVGGTCDDGLDNDCDGPSDCNDTDCADDPACACAPRGTSCAIDDDCCSSKCRGSSGNRTCK